jgi:DNA ligase 1
MVKLFGETMSVYNIIKTLEKTSSRLEKEQILSENSGNHELMQFFKLALDSQINFYIKKIPAYTLSGQAIEFSSAMSLLGVLSTRQKTGNEAIEYLNRIFSMLSMEDALMLERIIGKNPQCDVSTSTVNKIWPELVTDIPYMRCSLVSSSDVNAFDWESGVFSQEKADGMFVNLSVTDSGVSITSRNGTPFPVDKFEKIKNSISHILSVQFHGEMLVSKKGQILQRKISNGIMNSVLHGDDFPKDHEPVFVAWDMIPLSEATAKNKYKNSYKKRFEELQKTIIQNDSVSIIPTKVVYSYEEAYAHFQEMRKQRKEGTIIKCPTAIWEDTTSKKQIKMKQECDIDLKIVGFKDAAKTSKNSDLFGSILMESSDGKLEVSVTGFTDKLRKELFEMNPVGKIGTIRGNELMKPSKTNKKYSVFLPRWIELREDKTEADSIEQIISIFESSME